MTATLNDSAAERLAEYREFLGAKARLATPSGLDVDPDEVHPILKPHRPGPGAAW